VRGPYSDYCTFYREDCIREARSINARAINAHSNNDLIVPVHCVIIERACRNEWLKHKETPALCADRE